MGAEDSNRSLWRFIDGSLSVSISMLLAVLMGSCGSYGGYWGISYLNTLTQQDNGVIILGTLFLFPSTLALYGVLQMWFAAKEAVERRAIKKGRKEERERISKALTELGVELPPEVANILSEGSDADRPAR